MSVSRHIGSATPATVARIGSVVLGTLLLSTSLFAFPASRSSLMMTYDEVGKRPLVFGGVSRPDVNRIRHYFGDTWTFTGRRWVQQFPLDSPSARAAGVMVYDTTRKRAVLFGGESTNSSILNDTWIYANGNWTELFVPSVPAPRRSSGAAYDPIRDRIVLFGGNGTDAAGTDVRLFDTWEFDGTTWRLVQQNGPDVIFPTLVFDAARNEVLMLAGTATAQGDVPVGSPRMYRWDGSSWTRITPETMPRCIALSQMVFQKHNDRVLRVGGACFTFGDADDKTLEWDGENWHEVETNPGPGFISGHGMTYDSTLLETVLYGGTFFGDETSATWRYADGIWSVGTVLTGPGPRSLFVFGHDPEEKVSYLYGGQNEGLPYNDLWRYVDRRWERVAAENAPSGCGYPVGTFDTDRKRLVIVCEDSAVFEFDGATWHRFESVTTKPPFRRFSSMAYDPNLRRTVLVGGYMSVGEYLRDTWTWDGTRWTRIQRTSSGPQARMLTALFYDPVQGRVMMFGGIGQPNRDAKIIRYDDMWSLDGTTWRQVTPAAKPPTRYGASALYDPNRDRVVMFGGKSEKEEYLNEQWEWNGTTWMRNDPPGLPEPRMNGGFVFDTASNALVYYGGYAGKYFSELWQLDLNGWRATPPPSGRNRAATPSPTPAPGTGSSSVGTPSHQGELPPMAEPALGRSRGAIRID